MKGEIVISGTPECLFVLKTNDLHDFHFLLSLDVPREDNDDSFHPVNLAVVMDVSSSMMGSKLKFAKRAIRKVIKHMRPCDKLHVVTYSDEASVVVENADLSNKPQLEKTIKGISAFGCTNISQGLSVGFDCIRSSTDFGGSMNPMKRIFLFSDGQANKGILDNEGIFELVRSFGDVSVFSFGIGERFDEILMTGIANHSGGRFYYLEEETITSQTSRAIHNLKSVIGCEGTFSFFPSNGIQIQEIYSDQKSEDKCTFHVGDITKGNIKEILMSLSGSIPSHVPVESRFELFRYEFSYRSFRKQSQVIRMFGSFEVEVTNNKTLIEFICPSVFISTLIHYVATKNEEIITKFEEEDNNIKEVIIMKERIVQELELFKHQDISGQLLLTLENEKKSLETMKQKQKEEEISHDVMFYRNVMKKILRYDHYRERGCSKTRMRDDGYDSDEERWSRSPSPTTKKREGKFPRITIIDNNSYFESEDDEDDERRSRSRSPVRRFMRKSRSLSPPTPFFQWDDNNGY